MVDGRQYQAGSARMTELDLTPEQIKACMNDAPYGVGETKIDSLCRMALAKKDAEAECERLRDVLEQVNTAVTVGASAKDVLMQIVLPALHATPPPEGEPEEPLVCIWSGEWNQWWRPNSAGYTPDWREAGVYPISKARKILAGVGDEKKLEIVNHTPDAPYTPEQPSYCPRCTQEMDRYSVTHCPSCNVSVGGPPPSEQAHGDALAALDRIVDPEPPYGKNGNYHFGEDLKCVRRHLTASGVPEGWKLVPVEPTIEMTVAGGQEGAVADVYRAMIAAAPTDGRE